MTELQNLETQLLTVLARINLRRTLDDVALAGEILERAKAHIGHGNRKRPPLADDWKSWCRRHNLGTSTARLFRQIAREKRQNPGDFPENISVDGFLRRMRAAKKAARREDQHEARRAAIDADVPVDKQYKIVHSDCREYKWPKDIDVIV